MDHSQLTFPNTAKETKAQPPPLHPLPIPDDRCDSITIDFIGPLPLDDSCNYLITIMDRLGSDLRFIPTTANITAEHLATLFFNHWYCKNSLPKEIISDRDKLFISKFWKQLIVTILFFLTHVEHAFLISVSLLTCFFSSLFHEHVLSLDYSFPLQHAVYTFISYMHLTGLLHMFSMPLT